MEHSWLRDWPDFTLLHFQTASVRNTTHQCRRPTEQWNYTRTETGNKDSWRGVLESNWGRPNVRGFQNHTEVDLIWITGYHYCSKTWIWLHQWILLLLWDQIMFYVTGAITWLRENRQASQTQCGDSASEHTLGICAKRRHKQTSRQTDRQVELLLHRPQVRHSWCLETV